MQQFSIVYVLRSSYAGSVKWTNIDVSANTVLLTLSTGVPVPSINLRACADFTNKVKKALQLHLPYRVNPKREFFRLTQNKL